MKTIPIVVLAYACVWLAIEDQGRNALAGLAPCTNRRTMQPIAYHKHGGCHAPRLSNHL